jgi:hypothetical protein
MFRTRRRRSSDRRRRIRCCIGWLWRSSRGCREPASGSRFRPRSSCPRRSPNRPCTGRFYMPSTRRTSSRRDMACWLVCIRESCRTRSWSGSIRRRRRSRRTCSQACIDRRRPRRTSHPGRRVAAVYTHRGGQRCLPSRKGTGRSCSPPVHSARRCRPSSPCTPCHSTRRPRRSPTCTRWGSWPLDRLAFAPRRFPWLCRSSCLCRNQLAGCKS